MSTQNQILEIESITRIKKDRSRMHTKVHDYLSNYANCIYPPPALAADKMAALNIPLNVD